MTGSKWGHLLDIDLELSSVQFKDLSLVMTATSAPAARERTDYQCMEFLVGLGSYKSNVPSQLTDSQFQGR
jgi:hypothetical protein